jgi:predicted CXXCH cytochrome family protein
VGCATGTVLLVAAVGFCQYAPLSDGVDPGNGGSIADEITNLAEREAFLRMVRQRDATRGLSAARDFLKRFPQSAFTEQALAMAARASFDLDDDSGGLRYARDALAMLPESPLLLTAVADAEAKVSRNDAALADAQQALLYLDRFDRPRSIAGRAWPGVKRSQEALAYFAIGRAQLQRSVQEPSPVSQRAELGASIVALRHAHALNASDEEIVYVLAVAELSHGQPREAAYDFAQLIRSNGHYASRAVQSLRQMYLVLPWQTPPTLGEFLQQVESEAVLTDEPTRVADHASTSSQPRPLPDYAGSAACSECHAGVYKNWQSTGMARMLRPYASADIIGNFSAGQVFHRGEHPEYLHGRFSDSSSSAGPVVARMVQRAGRPYFELLQAQGEWHAYRVDFTIGSKWQQAYATRLGNGEIHVLPLEFNRRTGKWLNYWESIDGPGSERDSVENFERLDDATRYETHCAVCHTSQFRIVGEGSPGSPQFAFREPGVDCEMCHGPSAAHVAAMQSGTGGDRTPIDPPVDFRALDNEDSVKICAQCHSQSAIRNAGPGGELNYSRTGTFFRVNRSVPFTEFTRRAFYKDGRFAQTTFIVESLKRSKCFRLGHIACTSCHDPHGHDFASNTTSLKYRDSSNLMCTGCHVQFADSSGLAAHSHHPAGSEASKCVSCHMPRIMDALGFEARTHRVDDIPNAEMTLRFGKSDSPNACLLCHTGQNAQWVKQQLTSWKAVPVAELRSSLPSPHVVHDQ